MEHSPPIPRYGGQIAFLVVFLLLLGGAGLAVSIVFLGVCPPLGLLPLVIVGLVFYALIKQITKVSETRGKPLIRRPAVVLEERTKITGGDERSSARTRYFAMLEFPDALVSARRVRWEWIRGHTGHPENERCDELARQARISISSQ